MCDKQDSKWSPIDINVACGRFGNISLRNLLKLLSSPIIYSIFMEKANLKLRKYLQLLLWIWISPVRSC